MNMKAIDINSPKFYKHIHLDDVTKEFLSQLRELRLQRKMSQAQLCRVCDMKKSTYGEIESGSNYPWLGTLLKLAEFFGYDLSGSINYQYFFRELSLEKFQQLFRDSGVSIQQISQDLDMAYSVAEKIFRSPGVFEQARITSINAMANYLNAKAKERRGKKHIVPDDITCTFLDKLPDLRADRNMTSYRVGRELGLPANFAINIENGKNLPVILSLVKLAELFDYDISGSVNYKYYHRGINAEYVRKLYWKSGVSAEYLADVLRIHAMSVRKMLRDTNYGDLILHCKLVACLKELCAEKGEKV